MEKERRCLFLANMLLRIYKYKMEFTTWMVLMTLIAFGLRIIIFRFI